jgi:hypothetical protein
MCTFAALNTAIQSFPNEIGLVAQVVRAADS